MNKNKNTLTSNGIDAALDKRLKETTIYNRAFIEITKNENYITKSGQIF